MPLRRWGKPVQFPVQSKGEWLAILRLKVVSTTPFSSDQVASHLTACVPRSPKAKNISAGWARQKANGRRFSEIRAHVL
jgi:hypothetical protein